MASGFLLKDASDRVVTDSSLGFQIVAQLSVTGEGTFEKWVPLENSVDFNYSNWKIAISYAPTTDTIKPKYHLQVCHNDKSVYWLSTSATGFVHAENVNLSGGGLARVTVVSGSSIKVRVFYGNPVVGETATGVSSGVVGTISSVSLHQPRTSVTASSFNQSVNSGACFVGGSMVAASTPSACSVVGGTWDEHPYYIVFYGDIQYILPGKTERDTCYSSNTYQWYKDNTISTISFYGDGT